MISYSIKRVEKLSLFTPIAHERKAFLFTLPAKKEFFMFFNMI